MSSLVKARITPLLVRWAIERSRLPSDVIAKKIHVESALVVSWGAGNAFPTIRQAQKLARTLNVPFGYFFLSSPPEEMIPLPDLRTISGTPQSQPSPEFLDTLYDVLRKQHWYQEYLEEEGREPLQFAGSFTVQDDVQLVASKIRSELGVDKELRKESGSWTEFLKKFIHKVEDVGILVIRTGVVKGNPHRKLSVDEFQGFAISNDLAPLIFINGKDWIAAQTFTLAHELVHIWIGESGISNIDLRQTYTAQNNPIERFCDRVAAEVLVPQEDFLNSWVDTQPFAENWQRMAYHFRVSKLVVLRRAYEFSKITRTEYLRFYEAELEIYRNKTGKTGGGDYYNTLQARNSGILVSAVVSAAFEGRLLFRDAASLLNVGVPKLEKIAERLELR